MISFFHRFMTTWFGFNKQQRNGLLVLCMIILVLFCVRLSLHHLIKPEPLLIADFSNLKSPLLNETIISDGDSSKTVSKGLFVFDPNTVRKDQLLKLGFKEKTANTLINYRNKGGHFSKKEDLKKVYGLSEQLYKKLEPFIFINEKNTDLKAEENNTDHAAKNTTTKPKQIIELNSADSMALLSLKGIGPGFTKRILKYRSLLGGFVSIEQLREVYGLEEELYNSIKNELTVDPSLIKKININNPNFKELNAHPYLSYEETKAIFNYRRTKGDIKTFDQLKEIIGEESTIKKLTLYLELH